MREMGEAEKDEAGPKVAFLLSGAMLVLGGRLGRALQEASEANWPGQ